jgi:DNA helicase HerA-like ATPase
MTVEMQVGTLEDRDDGAAATLDPTRFNRHTFWCGQSGSGKTYALGVVLEQLLLQTQLPMLILDPNADFTRLGQVRDGVDPATAEELRAGDIRVLHPTSSDGEQLRIRFVDMEMRAQAAVFQLDPLADAEEYNALLHATTGFDPQDRAALLPTLRASDDPWTHRLALRMENLGVLDWELWAWGGRSAEDVIDERPRATVLDLDGFRHPAEPRITALSVLDHLWRKREERRPILIVIDEAHNLCPPEPRTAVEAALTDRIVQIAAEGRKYGLWLLLSTQRPSKIHPNVLSQCDNLGLMKMSAPRDLADLAETFGYAPAELLARSPHLSKGQALLAGGFISEPSIVRIGERLTHEGGTDVSVPIAERSPTGAGSKHGA